MLLLLPVMTDEYIVRRERKFVPVMGWNRFCRNKYSDARLALLEWIKSGKSRNGPIFENMKRTRKIFVNSLNFAKKNKKNIADNILAEKYASNNSKDFWKEVKGKLLTVHLR